MPTSPAIATALRRKPRKTPESRFWLRFYTTLLASAGLTYEEVSEIVGISSRSARRWFQAYKQYGDSGLEEQAFSGRPARLTPDDTDAIRVVIRSSPRAAGMDHDRWTGKALSEWVQRKFAISITDRRGRQILRELRNK